MVSDETALQGLLQPKNFMMMEANWKHGQRFSHKKNEYRSGKESKNH